MTGRRVLGALASIVFATAVVPPATAWAVNRHRMARAAGDVASLATRLRAVEGDLRKRQASGVLVGPGRLPQTTRTTTAWVTAPRGSLDRDLFRVGAIDPDPWGNAYLANTGSLTASEGSTVWVLSAGPNGIIETPYLSGADTVMGDDIAARVR